MFEPAPFRPFPPIEDMSREHLEEEIDYLRRNLQAMLWNTAIALKAEYEENGYSAHAASIHFSQVSPMLGMLDAVRSRDYDYARCWKCGQRLHDGDIVVNFEDEGEAHAACTRFGADHTWAHPYQGTDWDHEERRARAWILEVVREDDVRTCRECGCTDDAACDGGCWWVKDDLCSACAKGDDNDA